MKKVKVRIDYDFVVGYLKYGHREGVLEFKTKEEYELFKQNPYDYIKATRSYRDLKFILDDYELEDWGDENIEYEEIDNE